MSEPSVDRNELARLLLKSIEEKGFSQNVLAQRVHTTSSWISQIVNGKKLPSPMLLRRLSVHLNLPFDELVELRNKIYLANKGEVLKYQFTGGPNLAWNLPAGDQPQTKGNMPSAIPLGDITNPTSAPINHIDSETEEKIRHVTELCTNIASSIRSNPGKAEFIANYLVVLARELDA